MIAKLLTPCSCFLLITYFSFPQSKFDALIPATYEPSEYSIEDKTPLTVGFSFIYGYAIPHAKEVVNVRGTNPRGYQLNLDWLLYTKETWDDCHCYPRLGFHAAYYDFDITEIFGHGFESGINFTYFLGIPTNFNFLVQGKAGLSYLTKPYDRNFHRENMSYSTHLNYHLSAAAGLRFELSRYIETKLLLSMNHNSNAALTEPNGGINYPAISIGLDYNFNPIEIKQRTHPDPYLTKAKAQRMDISLFWGISAMPFPDPAQVPMFGVNFLRSWQVMRFGAITAGAEVEMNGRARLRAQRGTIEEVSPWRGSIQGGWEFLMGNTIFSVQLGYYVFRPHKEKDDIYQRYGLVYRIFNNLYTGINFKSYRHFADHLDLRLTFSF